MSIPQGDHGHLMQEFILIQLGVSGRSSVSVCHSVLPRTVGPWVCVWGWCWTRRGICCSLHSYLWLPLCVIYFPLTSETLYPARDTDATNKNTRLCTLSNNLFPLATQQWWTQENTIRPGSWSITWVPCSWPQPGETGRQHKARKHCALSLWALVDFYREKETIIYPMSFSPFLSRL